MIVKTSFTSFSCPRLGYLLLFFRFGLIIIAKEYFDAHRISSCFACIYI